MNFFGTDGIRGKAGEDLTNYLVARIGQALAEYLVNEQERLKVVVGRDTRVSGAVYEEVVAKALADYGVEVIVLGVAPTPVIAYYIRYHNAGAGVVISASHNPPEYNGIKLFDARGHKFTEVEESKIEALMEMNPPARPLVKGNISRDEDFEAYCDYLIREIKPNLKGLKIYLDCAEGASYKLAPMLFRRLTSKVMVTAAEGRGDIINVDCGATVPERLAKLVKESGCDIGFSFDGDADRLIAVSQNGEIIDGDCLMYMHAVDMHERGRLKGSSVVGTVMSNLGFDNALKAKGINLVREAVGDKYVFYRMFNKGYNLGGEQSGHLIFLDYQTTGDGILSALLTAQLVARTGKTLKELCAAIKSYPQKLTFITADAAAKRAFEQNQELHDALNALFEELGDKGRVVVRPSGTENKIRIMVEAETEQLVDETTKAIEKLISKSL